MPNPTLKSLTLSASLGLCACEIPPGSDVYHPYSPPRPIGEAYNPAIKIEADPARFPLGGTISVTASVYNKSNTGPSPSAPPPGLQLRVVAADANGDYPASVQIRYLFATGLHVAKLTIIASFCAWAGTWTLVKVAFDQCAQFWLPIG